ncbi:hypothetical protein [Paraliobacillus zengyii]|uniref:hypothetical protein n=1 Tax=Paraliobacillus zengyii TaxID=2213194 RepID=UPI000DD43339|nr:hypothetical protein [Paraliobacillus zengyii]
MIEQVKKYYNGKLTLINNIQGEYEQEEISIKEKRLMNTSQFGDEPYDSIDEEEFAVLEDINTLKNLMAFAEINSFKEILLVDMTENERYEVTQRIINNLDKFHVKPVGYEIKKDSIVIAWYLNSVINTFTFSDQSTALND